MMKFSSLINQLLFTTTLGIVATPQALGFDLPLPTSYKNHPQANTRESIVKKISRIQTHLNDSNYQRAAELCEHYISLYTKNRAVSATLHQMLGFAYLSLSQPAQSEVAYKKALAADKLPLRNTLAILWSLSFLSVSQENYRQAMIYLKDFQHNSKPESLNSRHYYFEAQLWANLNLKKKATVLYEKAIAMSKKPVPDAWLSFGLAVYFQLKDYPQARKQALQLVERHPQSGKNWSFLASTYLAENMDSRALAAYENAYKMRAIKDKTSLQALIDLAVLNGDPYKAGKYLKEGMNRGLLTKNLKNYNQLATIWWQAQEYEKSHLALKKVNKLDKSGTGHFLQGQIYVAQRDWKKASTSLKKALEKGLKKKKRPDALILLGTALYKTKDISGAVASFKKATKYRSKQKMARKWIKELNQQRSTFAH